MCEAARAVLRRCAHAEPPEVGGRRGASPADGRGSGELSVKASNDRAQDLWGAKASVALELVECGGDVVKCEPVAVERVAACDDLSCSRIDEHEAPVAALLGAGLDELESMPPRPAAQSILVGRHVAPQSFGRSNDLRGTTPAHAVAAGFVGRLPPSRRSFRTL